MADNIIFLLLILFCWKGNAVFCISDSKEYPQFADFLNFKT